MKKTLLKMMIACLAVFMMACSDNTADSTLHTIEFIAENIRIQNDITLRKEQINQLVLENEYDQAIVLIDDFYTVDDPHYRDHDGELKNLRRFLEALLLAEEGQLDEANEAFQNKVSRSKIPEELKPYYDETLTAFNKKYDAYIEELNESYAASFRENIQTITFLLEQQKYLEAAQKVHEQYRNKLKGLFWYETGLIDDETAKLFMALHDYAYAMEEYLREDYMATYTYMNSYKDPSLLPASLQKQYSEDRKVVMAAYEKYLNKWGSQQNYGSTSFDRKENNGCQNDQFDVCDYSDPYEFWYWHPDDFYDFEDAEDYWQKHYRN